MDTIKYNEELRKCETLGQILKVVQKYYDVDNCTIGAITKGGVIIGLQKAVELTRCKPK